MFYEYIEHPLICSVLFMGIVDFPMIFCEKSDTPIQTSHNHARMTRSTSKDKPIERRRSPYYFQEMTRRIDKNSTLLPSLPKDGRLVSDPQAVFRQNEDVS